MMVGGKLQLVPPGVKQTIIDLLTSGHTIQEVDKKIAGAASNSTIRRKHRNLRNYNQPDVPLAFRPRGGRIPKRAVAARQAEQEARHLGMHAVIVSGAGSGIGLEWVRAFNETSDVKTIYCLDLHLPHNHPIRSMSRVFPLEVDLTDEDTLRKKLALVHEDVRNQKLKVGAVIHSAGVRGLSPFVPIEQSNDVAEAETFDATTVDTIMNTFKVNAVGAFVFFKELAPLFREPSDSRTKVFVMSSRMGSIGHNTVGGGYAYRASKAALNAMVRSMSFEIPEATFTLVHPGRVESGLVAVKEDGAMEAQESVKDMLALLRRTDELQSGSFVDRFGAPIPW